VAITFAEEGFGTVAGAVYSPVWSMVPQDPLTQPMPEMLQVTAVFFVPVTLAMNCCCAPVDTVGPLGDTVTLINGGGGVMVTVAEPDTCELVSNVAVTATVAGFGTEGGAL